MRSLRRLVSAIGLGLLAAAILLAVPATPAVAQLTDPGQRLARAADDYTSGDHASAWFGFWTLAREGNAVAQFNLGQLYRKGLGVPPDLRIARYWYEEASAQGHPFAQYNLGIMHELGDGTPADLIEARAWYRRAAAQEVPGAYVALERLDRLERQGFTRQQAAPEPRPDLADALRNRPLSR